MNKRLPRLMLAAPKSGSGKTMITIALLKALANRGLSCRSFKCGPDYIDPMFHKYVLGIDGGNLDTYFVSEKQAAKQFAQQAEGADLSVIEGVMGFYDGVGGNSLQASSYEAACAVDAPVVLILDCKGASLSLAALVKGFLEYRKDSHIKGVILNRISPALAERLMPPIEALGVRVFGYLPELLAGCLESRHLGLVLPGELSGLRENIKELARQLEKTVDVEGLLKLAEEAPPLNRAEEGSCLNQGNLEKVVVGIARDEAFCFYYQENLELLKQLGAELVPFSPIHDKRLPKGSCGLLLGGGYPELYAEALSENISMRKEIFQAAQKAMPLLAECGGFMYLHKELETKEHSIWPMAGVIDARAFPTDRLSRFGYIEAVPQRDTLFLKQNEGIRGHEFHYWESTAKGDDLRAFKPERSRSWDCAHAQNAMLAGFPHFYYPSNPAFAQRFVEACRSYHRLHR